MGLMKSSFLDDGDLNVARGPVTVDLIHIPVFAVQGLAETLVVLHQLSALGQDIRLIISLGLSQFFKIFVTPLRSRSSHI